MSNFNLMIKSRDNLLMIGNLTTHSTVRDLKNAVSAIIGVKSFNLKIFGFPPKVFTNSDMDTLDMCGLKSDDILVVNIPDLEIRKVPLHIEEVLKLNGQAGFEGIKDSFSKTGIVMRKQVPANHSCLFTSIGFVTSGVLDITKSGSMRQLAVKYIYSQPETYTKVFLEKDPKEYCDWILEPNSWGGAIELAIMSDHYELQIAVANITSGTFNIFGEDKPYTTRVFLIFDGIHYDPLYLDPLSNTGRIQTIFSVDDNFVLEQVRELMLEAKAGHHSYQSLHNLEDLNVLCVEYGLHIIGNSFIVEHITQTGHRFFEQLLLNNHRTLTEPSFVDFTGCNFTSVDFTFPI